MPWFNYPVGWELPSKLCWLCLCGVFMQGSFLADSEAKGFFCHDQAGWSSDQALVNHWLSHLLCCWLGRCRPLVEGSSKPWEGNPVSSDHHFICNLQEWKFVLARADFNMLMKSWNVAAPSCNAFLSLFFLLLNVSDNEWQSENNDILCFFFWDKKTTETHRNYRPVVV